MKDDVIAWESRFLSNEVETGLYRVDVDTTFAVPALARGRQMRLFRTGKPIWPGIFAGTSIRKK